VGHEKDHDDQAEDDEYGMDQPPKQIGANRRSPSRERKVSVPVTWVPTTLRENDLGPGLDPAADGAMLGRP
jgi:hypothetical protein